MIITIVDWNISLVVAVVAVVVVLVFVVVFIVVVVVVVVVITWWLGNVRMVFFAGIVGVISVVGNAIFSHVGVVGVVSVDGNAIFSHVGIVSFVVAFVVGEMMVFAATTSWREVDERRKCGPLTT
jgi:hypothetical protein